MNRALLFLSLTLSVLALGVVVFSPSKDPDHVVAAAAPSVDPADVKLLERRVEQLEEDNDRLFRRLKDVERLQGADAGTQWIAAPIPAMPDNPQAFKDAVKDVQKELEREETAARLEKFRQLYTATPEQVTARWKAFAADAGLSWAQEQTMMGRLEEETARRKALFADIENGSRPRTDLRTGLQAISRDTNEALGKALDPAQLERFRNERRKLNRPGVPRSF